MVGAKILIKKLLVVKSLWKLRLVSFFVYVFMVPLSILHFKVDCVWFLSKMSAPISIQFILEMPQSCVHNAITLLWLPLDFRIVKEVMTLNCSDYSDVPT